MRVADEFGVFVTTREGETITSLLRRFKRKVTKSEVLKEYREHTEYLKPGVKKRRKQKESRSREEKEKLKMERDAVKRTNTKKKFITVNKEKNNETVTSD